MYSDSRSSLPTKSNPAPVIREPLFRPEVMVECQSQWLGTPLLQPRISHWVFATIGLVAAAAVLGMLFFASFPRKVRMAGWLVPQHGLVRVFAPQPGVIVQLHVREGQPVRMGEPLVVISTELHSEAMGATRQE